MDDATDRAQLVAKAREIVIGYQRGSVSLVQRLLKIRYREAADLLVELERQGVVGAIKGNGGREVLVLPWPVERHPDPGQVWKCGDEFLPFHPHASHIEPAYRDGWNRCYWMAVSRFGGTDGEITGEKPEENAMKSPSCASCSGMETPTPD